MTAGAVISVPPFHFPNFESRPVKERCTHAQILYVNSDVVLRLRRPRIMAVRLLLLVATCSWGESLLVR